MIDGFDRPSIRSAFTLLAGSAIVVGSMVVVTGSAGAFAFAGRVPIIGPVAVGAGICMLICAFVVVALQPRWPSGPFLAVLAALWFAPVWVGWQPAPAALGSIAAAVSLFVPALTAHLVAGFPDGMLNGHRELVPLAYAGATIAAGLRTLAYDPFGDRQCWADCRPNPFAVAPTDLAGPGATAIAAGTGAVVLAGIVVQRRSKSVPAGRPGVLATVAAATVAGGLAVEVVGLPVSRGNPTEPLPAVALALVSAGLVLVAAAHVAGATTRASRVARLRAVATGVHADTIDSILAEALRDPDLLVGYRVGERLVDANGHAIRPEASRTPQRITRVERRGQEVALIFHHADSGDLGSQIGPALRVALENECLRVDLDDRLRELRASRARIVAVGDARRRSLERDLHDGAQQELIALIWRMQSTADDLRQGGNPAAAAIVDHAVHDARAALGELRDVAHGIHPAVLANEGVGGALRTHALTTPVAVQVLGTMPRLADEAESAMYFFATAALDALTRAGVASVDIHLTVSDGRAVTVLDPHPDQQLILPPIVADRIGALGGVVAADGLSASLSVTEGGGPGADVDRVGIDDP